MRTFHSFIMACCIALVITGCERSEPPAQKTADLQGFIPMYNRYIREWLLDQQKSTAAEIEATTKELESAPDPSKEALETTLSGLRQNQSKWEFRLGLGDFLRIATPADLPIDLAWQDGMDQPEIGDPKAKKGGSFRRAISAFPPTIRPFGENSNHSFRGDLYDSIEMPLVTLHPDTMQLIPGVASRWATSPDGRTIYFKIDPEATYSDGSRVRAIDYLRFVYVRVSDHVNNPFTKQYFRENVAQVAIYDESTLSVSLPEAQIYAPLLAGGLNPSHEGFYQEYGPDYSERYQWRFPPTTGAYELLPDGIVKGVSITQSRVKNWWAKDRKYYKYRFNPDQLVHTVVRDDSKAFELFRVGELDTAMLTRPELWYEKSEVEPIFDGYIERVTFFNRYPKIPRGLYMNVSKAPLNDRLVRVGIHHAMNWEKVIQVMFRGDYQRLNAFNEGYALFSDPSIVARPYSIEKARQYFTEAGFTVPGRDGILEKPDGTRLSVSVTYPSMPLLDSLFSILREEALACGFDLRLDAQEDTVVYKKVMLKQHEMTLSSWLIGPPTPDFYQFLHSTNAYDAKGNVKPHTNNIFVWSRKDTDALSEKVRTATSTEELAQASKALQNIMHEEGFFAPGYSVDFVRVGSWRWVRWPDSEFTQFSPAVVFDPHESFVFWVDDSIKQETLAARRSGKKFPEVMKLYDQFRTLPASNTPEPDPE
ncbi:MAG: ABC transporter substrate-binding protein [Verrucomicrobia bacterium]|nr:MAG: ABC transporter substrate-binding protein [Verrucomicrobiota bacterium]